MSGHAGSSGLLPRSPGSTHPTSPMPGYAPNFALATLLLVTNAYLHYRLATERSVSWRWMLALNALDVAMLSAGVVAHRGLETTFFVGYYHIPRDVRGGLRIGRAHSGLGDDDGGRSMQRSASRWSPGWTSQRKR